MPRRSPAHDILSEPVRIGPRTLRNRFYQVPHCTGFGVHKPLSQAAHRSVKAEGGWAAICTEFAPVSFDSDEAPYVPAQLVDEDDLACLAVMADAVHEHGALAGIELTHAGAQASTQVSRWTPIGLSAVANEYFPYQAPRAMDRADIVRVHADWARAARRAASAGFDVVYVYGGTGYLPTQFLSPAYNKRADEYGGSLENRARSWLEAIEAVREAVGDVCAIAVRIGVDLVPGLDPDEALEFIRMADPLVDPWDVNVGTLTTWSHDSGPSRFLPEGHELQWTGRVREATAKPIVGVSRLTSPDRMAEIVRSGVWDMIGAARPSIADPFLPRKIEEGRYDEIRECIGCNVCIVKGDEWHHLGCTQNVTAGEEFRRGWHPERFERAENADRDVLVVVGGPAGMECAIVLGKRGYRRVHLVEAEAELGGYLRWVTQLPGLGEWRRVVDWRRVQLDKLPNVEVVLGRFLTTSDVLEYRADLVVIATGSRWATDGLGWATHGPIPGADASLAHVLTPEQVAVDGKRPPGRRVAVYDSDGYYTAASLAERLALDGLEVELVTSLPLIAPLCEHTLERELLCARLDELGVALRTSTTLTEIAPGVLRCAGPFRKPLELAADGAVLVTQRVADDELYRELVACADALGNEGIEGFYRVGDRAAPRLLADAIFDGHRLARELDAPDPAVPRPHRQERVIGTLLRGVESRAR